jgi:deoxyribonuclease-4
MLFCDRKTLGSTISLKESLEETLKYGNNEGMYSLQICLGSPMVFKRKKLTDDDIDKSKNFLKNNPINLFSHLPYVYNFAGSASNKILNWTGNLERDKSANSMIKSVEYELETISKICPDGCANGCVLHIGSWEDKNIGIQKVIETANKINFPEKSTLLLETMVGRGNVIGKSYQELFEVYQGIDENKKENIKICLDTCHVHSNGNYDLRKFTGVQSMFSDFEKYFEADKLGLIHLNDSMTDFNSGKDRHELIGRGTIWCDPNRSVLTRLLDIIDEKGIPTVLETDESDYRIIQTWKD